jgi:hypothetical protein
MECTPRWKDVEMSVSCAKPLFRPEAARVLRVLSLRLNTLDGCIGGLNKALTTVHGRVDHALRYRHGLRIKAA